MGAIIKLKEAFTEEKAYEKSGITHNYLADAQRMYYELNCVNGLFYKANGRLADGKFLFVRLKDQKVYGAKVDSEDAIGHHSYLSGGKKVSSVGYLYIEKGKLQFVSNESGHYKPMNEEMLDDLLYFYAIANNPQLIYEDHSRFEVEKILYRYLIADINRKLDFNNVTPVEKIKNATSNFHRRLKKNITTLWANIQDVEEEKSEAPEGQRYVDDKEFLFDAKHCKEASLARRSSQTENKEDVKSHYDDDCNLIVMRNSI